VWRQPEGHRKFEEPEVIKKILEHLGLDKLGLHNRSPPTRADGLFEPAAILI
jgi:hypothetical protein